MPNLIRVEDNGSIQIVTTFFSGEAYIAPNDGYEQWQVVGGAFKASITSDCRLEIISYLSSSSATGYIRLYDITPNTAIANRVVTQTIITNYTEATGILGATFTLEGSHIYQVQAMCSSSDPEDAFIILNVTPQGS